MAELKRQELREYEGAAEARAEMCATLQRLLDDPPDALLIVEKRDDMLHCRGHGLGQDLADMSAGLLDSLPQAMATFTATIEDEHNG